MANRNLKPHVRAHIAQAIAPGTTLAELHDIFMDEFGKWAVSRYGYQQAVQEWLQGLPSTCTVAFYNSDIVRLGYDWGALTPQRTAKATESAEWRWVESWWRRVSMVLAADMAKAAKAAKAAGVRA